MRADDRPKIGIHTIPISGSAAVLYTMQLAAMDGHTYLPYKELTAKAAALLGWIRIMWYPDSQPGNG
ncbi:MAG: hypothetical protein ACLUOI_06765 [Eisenbergiella sp.]